MRSSGCVGVEIEIACGPLFRRPLGVLYGLESIRVVPTWFRWMVYKLKVENMATVTWVVKVTVRKWGLVVNLR